MFTGRWRIEMRLISDSGYWQRKYSAAPETFIAPFSYRFVPNPHFSIPRYPS